MDSPLSCPPPSAIEQRKGVSFLVVAEIISLGDKWLNRKIYMVLNNYLDQIKTIIIRGIQSGEIKAGIDPSMASTTFLGIIQSLVSLWALSNYTFTLEEKYPGLWDFFRQSIQNPWKGRSPAFSKLARAPFPPLLHPKV
jgi:hypothetical protein